MLMHFLFPFETRRVLMQASPEFRNMHMMFATTIVPQVLSNKALCCPALGLFNVSLDSATDQVSERPPTLSTLCLMDALRRLRELQSSVVTTHGGSWLADLTQTECENVNRAVTVGSWRLGGLLLFNDVIELVGTPLDSRKNTVIKQLAVAERKQWPYVEQIVGRMRLLWIGAHQLQHWIAQQTENDLPSMPLFVREWTRLWGSIPAQQTQRKHQRQRKTRTPIDPRLMMELKLNKARLAFWRSLSPEQMRELHAHQERLVSCCLDRLVS